jgi:hypothetical protein
MHSTSILTGTLKVIAVAALIPLQGFGCGVEWRVPKDHFDGVNEYGYVSYWDKIGDLNLGEDLVIPLVIGFQSDRGWSSPYLGYGWILPLFDSNIVQTEDNKFEMIKPDGYTMPFYRETNKPTILSGGKGWKGEISGDTITFWATCGWRLTYTKGKITSIGTPKGKTLLISRDEKGVATEAAYDGKVIVRVDRDFKGLVTGLVVGEKRIGFEQTDKPRIQSILGKNVVAGKDMSLGKVTNESVVIKTCEYSVTDGLQPTLTVSDAESSPRQIAWNTESRFIMFDGDWKYDIKPSLTKGFNASIARKNKANQQEMWFLDSAGGQETIQSVDGNKKVRSWFVSGKFAGKLRAIVESKNGVDTRVQKWSYDEASRILRDEDRKFNKIRCLVYHYRGDCQIVETFDGDKLQEVNVYNQMGLLTKGFYANGKSIDFATIAGHVKSVRTRYDALPIKKVLASFESDNFTHESAGINQ